MNLPRVEPVIPLKVKEPFDHPDWLFELKYDGFRCLSYLDRGFISLVSKNGRNLPGFRKLEHKLLASVPSSNVILDGEIACLGANGRPQFFDLVRRRENMVYCAFDLPWLNGEDLRDKPLLERKQRLLDLLSKAPQGAPLLYARFVKEKGRALYEQVCELDLEGVVAKHGQSLYSSDKRQRWLKIVNPRYSLIAAKRRIFLR